MCRLLKNILLKETKKRYKMEKIKATIDRFENKKAVLRIEGEDIIIPRKYLSDFKEGDAVYLQIASDQENTESNQAIATELLKQIFQKNE